MSKTILLVAGSPERRHVTRATLEHAGYQVLEVVSLDRALAEARRRHPLAVVVEAPENPRIPAEFTHRIHHHPLTDQVPVIVLTPGTVAQPEQEQDEKVIWIPEPCSPRALLDEVAYLTRPTRKPGATATSMPAPRR